MTIFPVDFMIFPLNSWKLFRYCDIACDL